MKRKKKFKNIVLVIILSVIFFLFLFITFKQYQEYAYFKELKEVQAQYNDKQKNCISVGLTYNYVHITRTDEENKAIKGAVWRVRDYNKEEVGTFKTDEDGNGGLVGLDYGEYYLEEVSVPDDYEKKEDIYKVVLSAYDTSYTIAISNSLQNGDFLLVLLDQVGKPVQGKEYNVFNSDNEFITTLTTDEDGLAGLIDVAVGVYYVQENAKSTTKKYTVFIQDGVITRLDLVDGS